MRTLATVASFVLITGLYFLYGWAAVPLFLPSVKERTYIEQTVAFENPSREEVAPYLQLLPEGEWERNSKVDLHYLQFGDTIILFSKDTIEGRNARLEPCTVLMIPGISDEHLSESERTERIGQGVVLRAPLYAEIEFDNDFNLGQIGQKAPNITGCKLYGRITIASAMKAGTDDDFYLETENISISESPALTRITTLKDVHFRYGEHSGNGSMLSMELTPQNPKNLKSPKELNRVQFEKLKQLQLVLRENGSGEPIETNDAPKPPAIAEVHCQREFFFSKDVKSKGAPQWVASFLGNAEVTRTNPDGTQDHLEAEEFHLKFSETAKKKPATGHTAAQTAKTAKTAVPSNTSLASLEPVSFVANGKTAQNGQPVVPVRLRSQQNGGLMMLGDQMVYDISKGFLAVQTLNVPGASQEVEAVLENKYFIRSEKILQYTLGKENDIFGVLSSAGKGSLRGNIGDEREPKNIFLSWNAMRIAPCPVSKEQILLQLWGGITAEMQNFGTMTADKLDFWCQAGQKSKNNRTPKNQGGSTSLLSQSSSFIPDRAVIKDKVLFTNDKGVCKINRLDIFFETIQASGTVHSSRWTPQILSSASPRAFGGPKADLILQVQHTQPNQGTFLKPITQYPSVLPLYQAQPSQAVASRAAPIPATSSPAVRPSSAAQQSLLGMSTGSTGIGYEITGSHMRMLVKNVAGQSYVETLNLESGVVIEERVTAAKQGENVRITGNEVYVWNPSSSNTQIKISGVPSRPAVFSGRGAELTAQEISIDRAENKIWSPGAGQLTLDTEGASVAQHLQNPVGAGTVSTPVNALRSPQDNKLTVEWNQEMRFDGQRIRFTGKADQFGNRVKTLYQDKAIWCDLMEIHLNRLVYLFDDKSEVKPDAETIHFVNNVYVINEEYDERRQKKSSDSARFAKLRYHIESNTLAAEGPGVLRSMSHSSGKGFTNVAANIPGTANDDALNSTAKSGNLNFLSIWFQNYIHGTLVAGQKNVVIQGRVQAVYCPVDSWDDIIDIDNQSAARHRGYILECEQLQVTEMPDPLDNNKSSAELTASGNAKIDGSKIYGSAQTIKYNQAKNMVMLDGNARVHNLEQGRKLEKSAEMIQYDIDTGAIRIHQSQGGSIVR